jgi:hypothetical protein
LIAEADETFREAEAPECNTNPPAERQKALGVSMSDFNPSMKTALLETQPLGAVGPKDLAVIDVGLKVEGRVPLKEFGARAGWRR